MLSAPTPSTLTSQPPAPPTWPRPALTFPQFALLPAEIRQLVWEFYLVASPRIHVVHETGPAPPGKIPGRDEVLPYTVTTLDAATHTRTANLRRADVNYECWDVARCLRLYGDRPYSGLLGRSAAVWLSRDLQKSASGLRRGPEPRGGTTTAIAARAAAARADKEPVRPVHVDWANDLIFICSPSNEQAFRNLAETSWASRVERLAVLVPRRCESNIPFGPSYLVSRILKPMLSLKEIYVVMIPIARPAPDPPGPGNSWGRDRFGFVNYADYITEVGVTTKDMSKERHMTYQRTALSLFQALDKYLAMPGVKLRKVVDVDCSLFTESEYVRRSRWLGIKRAKA
ncbi:hypothetical protein AB5N19_08572 [Seiridium cardinale]|uniref:2EXR domain-containing protein n=1 Tax=Seiridium cardinale TaxID=138064 RepID=A0ABR2XP09_9PEZI